MSLVPGKLLRAHEDGEVVFFCGAGVSALAGLPSFKGLTEIVLENLIGSQAACKPETPEAAAWKACNNDRYDEALNILEHPRGGIKPKDVRNVVKKELGKTPKDLKCHHLLARLADLDKPNGRLVTTNFDHNFTKAAERLRRNEKSKHKTVEFIAPALPPAKPRAFSGLNYLHGKLEASEDEIGLVLTTTDFGNAYLLEGWARRFIIELSRHYHIVFIGYRVEDPAMRYLISAIAAARSENRDHFKEPYSLAPYGDEDEIPDTKEDAVQEWDLKGISPLPYDATNHHEELWTELGNWAYDHRLDIFGRKQVALKIGQHPPSDEHDPRIDNIVWALKEPPKKVQIAKFFAQAKKEDRPAPGWIPYLQEAGLLNLPVGKNEYGDKVSVPLVSRRLPDQLNLHEVTSRLGSWIAKSLDSQEALDWAIAGGGVLHTAFRREVQYQLEKGETEISPALRKIWRVLADNGYAHALSAHLPHIYPTHPQLGTEETFAIRIFLDRLRPIPIFSKAMRFPYEGQERTPDPDRPTDWCEIKIHLVGIEHDYDIDRFSKGALDWEGALAVMADDITTRLREAMDWQNEFGLATADQDHTYVDYPSVSPDGQNRYAKTWTLLISLARDSYDALAERDPDAATRLTRRWLSLPYPIFRRLALYAATGGRHA